ncbi:MAG: HD domain-containing protein [Planctomycetota bacterium]
MPPPAPPPPPPPPPPSNRRGSNDDLDGLPVPEAELLALPLLARATIFAAWMHRGQKRKYGGGEYIRHPLAVASAVGQLGLSPAGFAAALLHDTVEDTAARSATIGRLFGAEIQGWVAELTNPEFADKAARIEYFRQHIATLTLTATQIKLADRLGNLQDCGAAGSAFIARYTAEALVIVEAVRPDYCSDPIVQVLSERIRARVTELTAQIA